MNLNLSIIYIAYNRPDHLKKSIKSTFFLKSWFNLSYIFFIDGPKSQSDQKKIDNCHCCIESIVHSPKIFKSETNLGLKKNINRAFSYIQDYRIEKCFFLEDDIIFKSHFFDRILMDKIYNSSIFSLHNGFNFQSSKFFIIDDFNFSCWGWFLNYKTLDQFESFNKKNIFFKLYNSIKYDLHYCNFTFIQMIKNLTFKRSTWACFFCSYLFSINQKCLFPSKHLVENIGFDGTGSSSLFKPRIPVVLLKDNIEFKDFAYKYNFINTSKLRKFFYIILKSFFD